MNLQKYEEALDEISNILIPKHFKGDKSKYHRAKSKMVERLNSVHGEDMFESLPFFLPYFRRNFLYFCQHEQDFVGIVLRSVSNTTISVVLSSITSIARLFYLSDPEDKLVMAENTYQVIHDKITKIIDSPKTSKRDIHEVLNLIRPLSRVLYSIDIRPLYTLLLKELSYSLQIVYSIDNLDMVVPPDRIVINEYSSMLKELGNLNERDYSKYPIIRIIIKDLDIIYKRIEEFHSRTNPQKRVSDSGPVTTIPTNNEAVGLLGHIEGLTWDKIFIELVSNDSVRIKARDFNQELHFTDLNMNDKRSYEKYNRNWEVLFSFAISNGVIHFDEIKYEASQQTLKKSISNFRKHLKQIFGIDENPIEDYQPNIGYKAKFYIKDGRPDTYLKSLDQ